MADKLKIGIVGASGWMAGALAAGAEYDENGFDPESGKGNKSQISTVAALCDLNETAMKARKQELKLDNARLFTSYDEMLADQEIEAIIVAVPNNLHAAFAIKALEAGKHLFLEKPFATNYEDSKALMKAAQKAGTTTKIDYILCHYDEQEKLKELIDQNAFGEIASTHFTYRHPIQVSNSPEQVWKLSKAKTGGAIPMGICHAISLTAFHIDSDPVSVICKSSPAKLRDFDYDTQQDILVTFANGVVSLIQGNIDFAEKYDARHCIVGTEGQFDYTPYNPLESRVMWSSKPLDREYAPDPDFANDHLDSGNVWAHKCGKTVREFVKHALKGEKDPILGLDSPTVKRIEAIIWASEISAAQNGLPVVPEQF
jgi:predicted dehydrogenase